MHDDSIGDDSGAWLYGQSGWYFVDENEQVIIDSFSVTNPPTEDITDVELHVQYACETAFEGIWYVEISTNEGTDYQNTTIKPKEIAFYLTLTILITMEC